MRLFNLSLLRLSSDDAGPARNDGRFFAAYGRGARARSGYRARQFGHRHDGVSGPGDEEEIRCVERSPQSRSKAGLLGDAA
jgi:hypothetical protein